MVLNIKMKRKIPIMSTGLISAIALLLTVDLVYSSYVAVHGGYCMTYDSTLRNTLAKFEKCNVGNPRHDSWEFVFMEGTSSVPYLICIKNTQICGHIADDGKAYLAEKDENDFSQLWIPYPNDRFLNYVTGFYYCAQAMHSNPDDADEDDAPDYIQMQPCIDNVYQKLLYSDS